ncbi:hypothetical protein ACSU6B_14875 [Neobacillus sp. C211]|uniref:hypothetical protein n=1 Tax=Neobacillus sp. C211 TaxID=3450747 RepID=UPI003F43D66B
MKFKNGGIGTIVGTTAAYLGLSARLEIIGTNGTSVIENDQLKKHYLRNPNNETEAINLAGIENQNGGIMIMHLLTLQHLMVPPIVYNLSI